jgi:hypothetical protein
MPESVRLFMMVYPLFAISFGVLGLVVALLLWFAHPFGRLTGLAWLGLWIAEEIVVGLWTMDGPEVVQQAGGGLVGNLPEIALGTIMIFYLWPIGGGYFSNE